MSANSIQEFLTKVAEDQALQEELAKAMESENDREAVTTLAKSKGYDFTAEELSQAIEAAQAEIQAQTSGGELSEEELESVAGGTMMITVFGTTKSIGSIGSIGLPSVGSISKPKW